MEDGGHAFGVDVPLIVFLPNLPFELTMGVWLLVKGIPNVGGELPGTQLESA